VDSSNNVGLFHLKQARKLIIPLEILKVKWIPPRGQDYLINV
jgi:hypothetical protein